MVEFGRWTQRAQLRQQAAAQVSRSATSDSGLSSMSSGSGLSGSSDEPACRKISSSDRQSMDMESMLDFSFLLDPASKVRILHLDAVMQMRREYQAAILHQAVSSIINVYHLRKTSLG